MKLGEMISQKRKELGLTMEEVAERVHVTKATVSRWESGDIKKINRDKIDLLSRTLNMDPLLFIPSPEVLTREERELISAYRLADQSTRNSVRKVLDLPVEKEGFTEESAI